MHTIRTFFLSTVAVFCSGVHVFASEPSDTDSKLFSQDYCCELHSLQLSVFCSALFRSDSPNIQRTLYNVRESSKNLLKSLSRSDPEHKQALTNRVNETIGRFLASISVQTSTLSWDDGLPTVHSPKNTSISESVSMVEILFSHGLITQETLFEESSSGQSHSYTILQRMSGTLPLRKGLSGTVDCPRLALLATLTKQHHLRMSIKNNTGDTWIDFLVKKMCADMPENEYFEWYRTQACGNVKILSLPTASKIIMYMRNNAYESPPDGTFLTDICACDIPTNRKRVEHAIEDIGAFSTKMLSNHPEQDAIAHHALLETLKEQQEYLKNLDEECQNYLRIKNTCSLTSTAKARLLMHTMLSP